MNDMNKKVNNIDSEISEKFKAIRGSLTKPHINIPEKHEHFVGNGNVEYPIHRIKINHVNGEYYKNETLKKLFTIGEFIQNQIGQQKRFDTKLLNDCINLCNKVLKNISIEYPFKTIKATWSYGSEEFVLDSGYTTEDVNYYDSIGLPIPGKIITIGIQDEVDVYTPFYGYYLKIWFEEVLAELEKLNALSQLRSWPLKSNIDLKKLYENLSSSNLCSNSPTELEAIMNGKILTPIKWTSGKNKAAPVTAIVYFVKKILDSNVKPSETFDLIYNSIQVAGQNLNKASLKATISKRELVPPLFFKKTIDAILQHT